MSLSIWTLISFSCEKVSWVISLLISSLFSTFCLSWTPVSKWWVPWFDPLIYLTPYFSIRLSFCLVSWRLYLPVLLLNLVFLKFYCFPRAISYSLNVPFFNLSRYFIDAIILSYISKVIMNKVFKCSFYCIVFVYSLTFVHLLICLLVLLSTVSVRDFLHMSSDTWLTSYLRIGH